MAHEILANAGLTDIDAEFEQLAVNTRCAPKMIFATQPPNQFSNVFRNGRPPRFAVLDFPSPEQDESPCGAKR